MNTSILTKEEIAVSNLLLEVHDKMWRLGIVKRQRIYHRWEMLHLFTPKMTDTFEKNLQRIHQPG